MSLLHVACSDFPRGLYLLDDTSPYNDYSGYEHPATSTSTTRGVALCKGTTRSLIVSDSQRLSVPSTVFKQGKEYMPFSIGAFFRPIIEDLADTDEIQILGNEGQMDGLTIKGTVVSFVTKYTSTGEARASFDMLDYQSSQAYGVHTRTKNMLFVGAELVAQVDITAAQQADTYAATTANLSSGATASANKLMLNAVTIYDVALNEDSIISQFANGQDTLGAEDVSIAFRGALLEFAPEGALSPFFQITYSSDEEWNLGQKYNISQHDGTLYPVVSNSTSQAGYWETVVPLGYAPSTIYSANLLWEGTGATVTTSRDGITWSPAQKGKALSTIVKGTNGEGQFLFIRVTFPGGIVNDQSFFDNMVFSLYSFATTPLFNGREVVLDKVSMEDDTDVIDLHENWGAELQAGTLTIKAGTSTAVIVPKTIEVWGKRGAVGVTFTDNLGTADTSYTNGGTFKSYSADEWQVRHYVFNSGFTGDITFSGTGQIGHVILYPDAKTADEVAEIYRCYVGKPKISLDVDEVFDIKEFAGAVDIYEYDWTIESSG